MPKSKSGTQWSCSKLLKLLIKTQIKWFSFKISIIPKRWCLFSIMTTTPCFKVDYCLGCMSWWPMPFIMMFLILGFLTPFMKLRLKLGVITSKSLDDILKMIMS